MREDLQYPVDVWNIEFFRLTLLTSTNDEVVELIEKYERQSKALRKQLLRMCWHMRGSISIDQMFEIGFADREIISKLIEENIETTNESKLPFF